MPVPVLTINATLQDLFGGALPGASLTVQLSGYGSQAPRVAGSLLFGTTLEPPMQANASGLVTFRPFGNDVISPPGTYYTVQVADAAGNVIQTNAYRFAGAGAFDLSSLAPLNFAPILVPSLTPQFIRQPWAANMVFLTPAQGVVTFATLLTGNVLSSSFPLTAPGQIVGFFTQQDATGNHLFPYPANFIDAAPVAPWALARTFQAFQTMDDGNCYPFGVASQN